MPHRLNPENRVLGSFKLEKGRLTFRTGDPALTQRLLADRDQGRASTVCLILADPIEEFTGRLESVDLVKVERPQEWAVVMTEQAGKSPTRKAARGRHVS